MRQARKCLSLMFAAAILFNVWLCGDARASIVVKKKYKCRVCGTEFEDYTPSSYYTAGIRLDFKKVGSDDPWPMEQCPSCKFVLFESTCDCEEHDNRMPPEELEKVKAFVLSEDYQTFSRDEPTYYCLARIKEVLGESDFEVSDLYLKASWQVEYGGDWRSPAGYLEKSLEHLDKFVPANDAPLYQRLLTSYFKVELNRRLGRFDIATKYLAETEAVLSNLPVRVVATGPLNSWMITRFVEEELRNTQNYQWSNESLFETAVTKHLKNAQALFPAVVARPSGEQDDFFSRFSLEESKAEFELSQQQRCYVDRVIAFAVNQHTIVHDFDSIIDRLDMVVMKQHLENMRFFLSRFPNERAAQSEESDRRLIDAITDFIPYQRTLIAAKDSQPYEVNKEKRHEE